MSFSSDLAEDILPEMPEHVSAPRVDFLAWHRPRKQFIRHKQWNELIRRKIQGDWRPLLEKPSAAPVPGTMLSRGPLKCLVIPGEDLLDVQSLCEEISNLDCTIRYLGFNTSHGSSEKNTRIYVANNRVTSLPAVVTDSQVQRNNFETIENIKSQAYKYLRDYGPYHVVNLDFCGSLVPNTEAAPTKFYNAIKQLFEYQFAEQKTSWLFFVTTVIKPSVVDPDPMAGLCGPTKSNFDQHPDFATVMEQLELTPVFGSGDSINLSGLSDQQIISLFGVAFGKWLLQLCHTASPKWTIRMKRSYRYTLPGDTGSTMMSLAFELDRNIAPPQDATGMSTTAGTAPVFLSEKELALIIGRGVVGIKDVDDHVAGIEGLQEKMLNMSADLMVSAGYSREDYLEWAATPDQARETNPPPAS